MSFGGGQALGTTSAELSSSCTGNLSKYSHIPSGGLCPPSTRVSFALFKSLLAIWQRRGSLTLSDSSSEHSGLRLAGVGRMRSRGRARQVSEALRVGAHLPSGRDTQGRQGAVGMFPSPLQTPAIRASPSGRTCDSVLQPLEGAAALRPFAPPEGGALGSGRPRDPPSSRLWCVCSSLVRGIQCCSFSRLQSCPAARPRGVSVPGTRERLGALGQAPRPRPGWVGSRGERRVSLPTLA